MMKDLLPDIHNIVEICSAITIALLGLAYPIILDKISSIGERYSSKYLLVIFHNECVQRNNVFERTLYISLFSLVFHIFQFKPLFDWNNWFINNSANMFTLISTLILVIVFIKWVKKVRLYVGGISNLFEYVTKEYEKKKTEREKQYYFKSINELAIYSIKNNDNRLDYDLSEFYFKILINERNKYKIKDNNIGVVYPYDYYQIVSDLVRECVKNEKQELVSLQENSISGRMLIPNDFQKKKISEETYSRLWYNFTLIRNNISFVRRFWANSHQYYRFELEQIYPDYPNDNKKEIEQREKEQDRFLEFHYAVGGLLLYSEIYDGLNYIMSYSQSSPPKYVLLPYKMTDIFKWFEHFRNVDNHLGKFIGSVKYRFPNLDNLGNSDEVVFWICKYICILFLRQYKIPQTLYYQDSINQPDLPNKVYDLLEWKQGLEYFKFCFEKVSNDTRLLKKINLKKTYKEKKDIIKLFLEDLEKNINDKIKELKLSIELSTNKIDNFYTSSSKILSKSFEQYSEIINSNLEDKEDDMELWLSGSLILSNKSFFVEDDIPCMNCDSSFAQSIVLNDIQRYIPNSFTTARTHRYLLNRGNLVKGLDKIIGNKINEVCIIAFNLFQYEAKQKLEESKYNKKIIYLSSTDLTNCIFVLNKKDLPKIKDMDILEEEKQLLQPKIINKDWNIYGKIVDVNKLENKEIKEKYMSNYDLENEDLKVLLALMFRKQIVFSSNRKIIQIKLNSQFEELGTENSLSDLITL